jgi:hypothetical protein
VGVSEERNRSARAPGSGPRAGMRGLCGEGADRLRRRVLALCGVCVKFYQGAKHNHFFPGSRLLPPRCHPTPHSIVWVPGASSAYPATGGPAARSTLRRKRAHRDATSIFSSVPPRHPGYHGRRAALPPRPGPQGTLLVAAARRRRGPAHRRPAPSCACDQRSAGVRRVVPQNTRRSDRRLHTQRASRTPRSAHRRAERCSCVGMASKNARRRHSRLS